MKSGNRSRLSFGLLSAIGLLLVACTPNFKDSPTAERVLPPNAAPQGHLEADALVADDGTRLPLRVWLPFEPAHHWPAPIRAIIVALHGFNDRSMAFNLSAQVWQRDNIATYAFDQRGFGANNFPGRWAGAKTLAQDLATAVRVLKARYPDLPVYALGESMGGGVVLDAVGGRTGAEIAHPDGVILAAPAVWARRTMPVLNRVVLWGGVRLLPSVTLTGNDLGIMPTDNYPVLRGLGRDPLFIKATRIDAIYGLVDLMDQALDAVPRDTLPTLVLYGADDQVIPKEPLQQLARTLPDRTGGEQRFAYYPDGWHMLLRDIEFPIVADDVAAWIFDHTAPLPSGADQSGKQFVADALKAAAD